MCVAFPAGFGRHIWDVNYGQLARYLDCITPLAIIYIWYSIREKLFYLD